MQHDWIPSTLGHGNLMCRRCWATDLEAAAIGLETCPGPTLMECAGVKAPEHPPERCSDGPSGLACEALPPGGRVAGD